MREEHGEGAREEGTGEQHRTAALDVSPDTVLSRGVGIALYIAKTEIFKGNSCDNRNFFVSLVIEVPD